MDLNGATTETVETVSAARLNLNASLKLGENERKVPGLICEFIEYLKHLVISAINSLRSCK